MSKKIELGMTVKDKVTNFEGLATARIEYLTGCTRFEVQPVAGKDGKLERSAYFDEPRLTITDPKKVELEPPGIRTGGFKDDPPGR